MKNLYAKMQLFTVCILGPLLAEGQCTTTQTLGSASNMFTLIRNGNHPVAVDNSLNTVVFLHRADAGIFGGNSGQLRYDLSINGGTTWTNDIGALNQATLSNNLGRYPNAAIYNPTLNTTPANAYISYFAPTTDGFGWTGIVSGVQQLNGSGGTENFNQPGVITGNIQHSLVKGAPGTFWSIDPVSGTGFIIYKGTWNVNTSDIVWASSYTITPPYNTGWTSFPPTTDYNIGFDPSGQIGWVSFSGHVSPGPSAYGLYPVFYKTVNGGQTWTGPIQVDLNKFSCITGNIQSGSVPSTNPQHDLTVDANGIPHFFTTIGSAVNYAFNYNAWHHMFDITLSDGVWVAYDVANVNGAPQNWGGGTDLQIQAPQAARTADGSKVFFSWSNNSAYSLGTANALPDLFSRAFDIASKSWTPVKDFTSCNSNSAGKVLFPHMAPEVLQPTTNSYKIVSVYGVPTATNDMTQQSFFAYLDNTTFSASEFTTTTPSATVTIAQAPGVVVCPNSTVAVSISGNPGQVIWSTGATTNTLGVSGGTLTSVTATAQIGCYTGTASVGIINMTVSPAAVTPSICPGGVATFSATGNALGYTWTPGQQTGTNVNLYPTSGTVSLTAQGSSSCTSVFTVPVNILPTPSITIAGSNTICAGSVLSLTASGAGTGGNYAWDNGSTGPVITTTPGANTCYSVIGLAANTCTNLQSFCVVINPTPTLTATTSHTAICAGQTATLFASGAVTYSWDTGHPTYSVAVSPGVSTTYTVSGFGANGCSSELVVPMPVNALPVLTVTANKNFICKGEKITLMAAGASNYTWTSPASTSTAVIVTASATANYNLTGKDLNGCVNTAVYNMVVNPCTGIPGDDNRGEDQYVIYPNPNNGSFTIRSTGDADLYLLNQLGQVVSHIRMNETNNRKITLNGIAPGFYFLTRGDGRGSQKIIIR